MRKEAGMIPSMKQLAPGAILKKNVVVIFVLLAACYFTLFKNVFTNSAFLFIGHITLCRP